MSARVIILICSLALNAAWIATFVLRPSLVPGFARDLFQLRADGAADNAPRTGAVAQRSGQAARAARNPGAEAQGTLWSALESDDLPGLVARLRAAGFPPALVRAIISAQVDRRFQARLKALASGVETPYWQPTALSSFNNPKYFEERQQAYRDRSRLLRELLGEQALASAGVDPTQAQRQQFGDLSKAKIETVQRINDDYAEMVSQVRAATQGIMLPEDRAKLALLEREKRADLAAILTPAELEDYEMRSSPATMRLRSALSLIDASEAEFRAIFRIQQPFTEILYPSGGMGGMMTMEIRQRRDDAQKQVNEQLKATLGAARFAEFARAQHFEFQQLARLTQRENIPLATAVSAFELRTSTSEESQRIGSDPSLSNEQKLAAMQALAQKTRTQLLSSLGPSVGPGYTQSAAWLQAIEKGTIVTFSPDGNMTSFRPIASGAPPPR
jgi:hypothetical protein